MLLRSQSSAVISRALLAQIGNTPLLRISRVGAGLVNPRVEIYAKAEWFNPGGSIKDRAALNMILAGEKSGELVPGKTIIDATSGNTGIAYAMLGEAMGYAVHLAVPANASAERKRILESHQALVTYTDPLEGTDGAQELVRRLVAENPEAYFYPDQYNNPANWQAHFATTGPEIYRQTDGRLTHFVAGLGTTGTFVGTSRRLKSLKPSIRCISVQPDAPLHGLEGLKHLATAIVPEIYDPSIADANVEVSTEETYAMVHRLAGEEKLFVGPSSAANMIAALQIARTLQEGVVVTVFADHGDRYKGEKFLDR